MYATDDENTQTIYRFEYEDGDGIYWPKNDKNPIQNNEIFEFQADKHPTPEHDSLLAKALEGFWFVPQNHFFGFLSIEQLRSWFYKDEFLVKLHEKGIVIAEYECHPTDVLEGHTQAMFIREKSLGKEQFSILEYFNLEGV